MVCSQCGEKAVGKFCHQCGSPIAPGNINSDCKTSSDLGRDDDVLVLTAEHMIDLPANWEMECNYDRIARWPLIRKLIQRHASQATSGPTGEDFLKLFDKVVASPIPLDRLASVLQPLYESWGIRISKERNEWVPTRIGRTIASALCSLAKHRQSLLSVEQHDSGCVLTAELPSSLCALKGKVIIALASYREGSQVNAKTYIPGQVYDWGKSHRCLEQLCCELMSDLGLPASQARVA
ncbi:MAG: hypothetical protein IT423_07000 [Pirellulaceae bacterium]|nr:hypothetical protein [Pirellulaceae bacterium]